MDSSRKLGVMAILKEALAIPCRNKKLMLPILLLSFLPSSLLLMGNYISIYPLLLDFLIKLNQLSKNDPSTPQFYDLLLGIKRCAEAFVHVDTYFTVASYMVSFFSKVLIIYASAMTHSGKQLSVCNLLSRIKGSGKGPFLTQLCFTLLYTGYMVLSVWLIALLMLNASGSIGLIALGGLLALSARLLYVYLAMVWMVGVVISVVEEGCYGLEALGKAGDIVKGRRVQGFLIALVLLVVDGVLNGSLGLGLIRAQPQIQTQKATALVVVNVFLLLKLYSHMVYTVFYCECRKSIEKEVGMLREVAYTRVGTIANVDEAHP